MEQLTLTPEIKERMLGLLPFSADGKMNFTPDRFKLRIDLPPEFVPEFVLRPLTVPEKKEALKLVRNLSSASEEDLIERVRKNVIGWSKLFDLSTEKEIVFEADLTGSAKKELFERIPRTCMGDILFYLVKVAGLVDLEVLSLK